MAHRYDEDYRGDAPRRDRMYGRDVRGFMERAGDEVRSWFGDEEAERRRRMDEERAHRERMYGHAPEYGRGSDDRTYRGSDDRMYARGAEYDYGWASERSGSPSERGWGSERWARPERWTGHYGRSDYDRSSGSRGWNQANYGSGAWRAESTTQRRSPGETHGYYEDDRGRVYEFDHAPTWRGSGSSGYNYGPTSYGSSGYGYTSGNYGYEGRNFTGRGPKGWKRSDDRIREDVCERLTADWHIDASEIEVTVNNGEVTLAGTVHTRDDKRHAEDLSERVNGVRDVRNNLRVSHWDDTGRIPSVTGSTTPTPIGKP